jgi:glucose-6-phosphate 1-epimerase
MLFAMAIRCALMAIMQTVSNLNDQWASDGVAFYHGPGQVTVAELAHDGAQVRVALHGAHVLSYEPEEGQSLLWLSKEAIFAKGKAIRGGIPVCWPWCADHPSEPDYPAHGFARTRAWEVVETGKDLHFSRLTLALKDSEETRAWFPHAFELEMRVILSKTLKLQFTVINLGETEFTYTGALHTYFAVSHIDRVSVEGLKGCTYIDSIDGGQRKTQEGPIRFAEEVDRIYVDTEDSCVIRDEEWKRDTRIVKSGSRSTVVWNPWIVKAKRMADFGDDEYEEMVCVETTNAAEDAVTVPGQGSHQIELEIAAS